jgi:hypothetical protein
VECSLQEPVKRTAEANHPANPIREHSKGTQHAHQKPTAETTDPQKTRKTPCHAINSLRSGIRRNESQTSARRQRSGASTATINKPMLPPIHRQQPPLHGTEDHQARTSSANYRRNGRKHLLLAPDDRWYRPTFKTIQDSIRIRKPPKRSPFENIIPENRAVRKTRREPNRSPTKQHRSVTKSGSVQSTAENCPILPNCHTVPRHVVLLLHNTGKQQIRNYPKYDKAGHH